MLHHYEFESRIKSPHFKIYHFAIFLPTLWKILITKSVFYTYAKKINMYEKLQEYTGGYAQRLVSRHVSHVKIIVRNKKRWKLEEVGEGSIGLGETCVSYKKPNNTTVNF